MEMQENNLRPGDGIPTGQEAELKPEAVKVIRFGNKSFGISQLGVYVFEVAASDWQKNNSSLPARSSCLPAATIGDFSIISMGDENSYPEEVQLILSENPLLPEMLNKKAELLWGQGPALYKTMFKNNQKFRYWEDDKQITDWLESWNFEEYLRKTIIEFSSMNGFYSKFFLSRGQRIGSAPMISQLEHIPCSVARLEWPDEEGISRHVITGSFDQTWKRDFRSYPTFDPLDPFAHPVSMRYSNLYCFALDYDYSRSPIHGLFPWAKLSASISKLLTVFNANSMALKYHIEIPAAFWENEKEMLQSQCVNEDRPFTEALFRLHQDKLMAHWVKVLSGRDNVGKFITTPSYFDETSQKNVGFKITPLDMNVKDYMTGELKIAHEAAFQLTQGVGLHNQLSDIAISGNLSSGSEALYSLLLYLKVSVDIPERIVLQDINSAIKVNFPASVLQLGFYHEKV